jgi:hypothetical protein
MMRGAGMAPARRLGLTLVVLVVSLVVSLALARTPASAHAASTGLRVRGNQLVVGPGRGRVVQLRGVNRSGLEYACIQGWGSSTAHTRTGSTARR